MATATQARQPEKGLTFEDVWAAMLETEKRFQETDKRFQESRAEHDRMIAETNKAIKEMSARVDRVTQNVGGLNRSIGELIETLIAAQLWEKFAAYPYQLKRAYQHLNRMKLIRAYPPLEVVGKRLLGAIAGGVVLPDTVEYAHKAGFFVLTLTGESVTLLDTPTGFLAREW